MQPCSFYAHLQAMPVEIYHLTNRQRTVWERSQQWQNSMPRPAPMRSAAKWAHACRCKSSCLPKNPAKQEQIPTQRGQRAAPAPVSVIAAMVKRAADCILFLQSVHFRCPDDCLKTGLFCLSEYKILLLRCMMTDFG